MAANAASHTGVFLKKLLPSLKPAKTESVGAAKPMQRGRRKLA